jgi:AGZA family xanthine/uracil permease-like MFS transporter
MELYTGCIQFISCLYVLPVVPFQMARVGYDEQATCISTAATCAIGCIVGAFLTDMPFIIAPPTSVSIFFAVSMQQAGMTYLEGNAALIISGAALAFLGFFPPVGRFFTRVSWLNLHLSLCVSVCFSTLLSL